MKNIIYLLLLLSTHIIAQPADDIPALREQKVQEITKALLTDPGNVHLIWERVNLIFDPYFDIYTKPHPQPDIRDASADFYGRTAFAYKDINILTELNKLIEKKTVIIDTGGRNNGIDEIISNTPASLYFRRGQYYYLNNLLDKALDDYLMALNTKPSDNLKERICFALAVYYYNSEKRNHIQNMEKALEYIDMVTPLIYETQPRVLSYYSEAYPDRYEQEKIMLLKETHKKDRLKGYLQNLAISYLTLYLHDIHQPDDYKKQHSYTIPETLKRGLSYLSILSDYYFENGEVGKSHDLVEAIMKQLQPL